MIEAVLIRRYRESHTTGVFIATDSIGNVIFQCQMLELPWIDNTQRISCIPEGRYRVQQRRSQKFALHYHILDVPGRNYILQHPGNFTTDIKGCQLPGSQLLHLNNDIVPDVRESRATLMKMLGTIGFEYTLHITSVEPPPHAHTINPKTMLPV